MRAPAAIAALLLAVSGPWASSRAQTPATPVANAVDPFAGPADQAQIASGGPIKVVNVKGWPCDFIRENWWWHFYSQIVIFICVILVLLFGIFVSWLQFRDDIASNHVRTLRRRRRAQMQEEGPAPPAYDFATSLQSVPVKSKTIGALVLVFSAAFFFLYLRFVYPVTVLTEDSSGQSCWEEVEAPVAK